MSALDAPEEAERIPERIERIKKGEWVHEEILHRKKDGTLFPVEISAGLISIGDRDYVIGIDRDISDRKKAEKALQESEERFRRLADDVSFEGLIIHEQGKIVDVNKNFAWMYGYERNELIGMNAMDTIAPHARDLVRKHIGEGWESVYEATGMRKDGTLFPIEVHAKPFPLEGKELRAAAVRDLSERKRSEENLNRLFTAVEQAGETIMITDPEGTILYVNPAFEKTTGFSVEDAIGEKPSILASGKHGKEFYTAMQQALQQGDVWRGRFTNKKKDGTLYEETATISPIKDEAGRVVNHVMVGRDVTSEIMLQKQLLQAQKMEAVGTLAGGMAHDFNNLLQAILGYTDLLLMRKGQGDPDRPKLEIIHNAARDGADLVSRILTFSRKAESKTRPIDLNEEIRKAEKLLRRTVPKMIEIRLVLADGLGIIDADPAQIEQVLLNLAVNAQHAMPDGGRLLIETCNVSLSTEYLGAQLVAKPGRYALMTVSDTGMGMMPDVVERIFDPFFTTKTSGEGTGLGLAMVHGIVSQHGGYIRCHSEPGIGSSFKIYFPVSAAERLRELADTREMSPFGTETILLVDDDDRVRELVQEMIQSRGYRVLVARSGNEALEIYAAHTGDISLVILDLIMPGMSGEKCLDELVRIDPDVKVLVASGYSSSGLTLDDKLGAAMGFIRKPYDAKDMLGAIRTVLDRGKL